MEENAQSPSLMSHAVRSGVILAAISIVITLVVYLIDASMLVSFWMILLLLVSLALVIYFGIQYRNQVGGFIGFGSAWKHGFFTLAIAGLIGTLFNLLLYNVIDPELPAYLTDVAAENAETMTRNFGGDQSVIDQAVEDTRERTKKGFTAVGLFTNFGIALIVYAVIALITGAIVKKNNPEEAI